MKQTIVIGMSLLTALCGSGWACSKKSNNMPASNGNDTSSHIKDSSVVKDSSNTTVATYRYLALGDSYTIGESVAEADRYPVQLQTALLKDNIKITDLNIIARTGWTTYNLLNALQSTPPAGTYNLVTLLIGVNNQYQGLSISQYSTEFTTLLQKSIEYAGNKNRVVVISIPDYSVVPFAYYSDTVKIRKELQDFNKVNKDITTAQGIKYVDVFALSQEARYNKSLVARDSLHFSGLEYAKWTNLLLLTAKEILK
jgi:lysophospholipase L1-like esterase